MAPPPPEARLGESLLGASRLRSGVELALRVGRPTELVRGGGCQASVSRRTASKLSKAAGVAEYKMGCCGGRSELPVLLRGAKACRGSLLLLILLLGGAFAAIISSRTDVLVFPPLNLPGDAANCCCVEAPDVDRGGRGEEETGTTGEDSIEGFHGFSEVVIVEVCGLV